MISQTEMMTLLAESETPEWAVLSYNERDNDVTLEYVDSEAQGYEYLERYYGDTPAHLVTRTYSTDWSVAA